MSPIIKLLDIIIFLTAIVFAVLGGVLISCGGYLLGVVMLIASSYVAWLFGKPILGNYDD